MSRAWIALAAAGCAAEAQEPPVGGDDDDACAVVTVYDDLDGDGYGVDGSAHEVCALGAGEALANGDCDDAEPTVHPGAAETWYDGVDQDCLGGDDFDADLDGALYPDDCDDADPTIYPAAPDPVCDRIDSDCDGSPGQCEVDLDLAASAQWWGSGALDNAGSGLDFAGDVNGDGYDDVIVGAYSRGGDPWYPGTAYLVLGPSSSGDLESVATARFFDTGTDTAFWGREVAGAGDTNGDGFDDVWISDYTSLYLFQGPLSGDYGPGDAASKLSALAFDEETDIRAGRDATGDGMPDLLIGTERGALLVPGPFAPGTASAASAASLTFVNSAFVRDCTGWGTHTEFAGDTDGDGVQEIVGSAWVPGCFYGHPDGDIAIAPADQQGVVDVATGSGALSIVNGAYGDTVGVGDFDADGYDDIAINGVFVVSGPLPAEIDPFAQASFRITFTEESGGPTDLEPTGDIDGDGAAELLLVGRTADPYSAPIQAWFTWGASGRTGTISHLETEWHWISQHGTFAPFERGVGQGDVDGDGALDLLITQPRSLANGSGGTTWLITGGSL